MKEEEQSLVFAIGFGEGGNESGVRNDGGGRKGKEEMVCVG